MSNVKLTQIQDFLDGEIHINVDCDFTIFVPPMEKAEIYERIKAEFNEVMMKYAI